MNSENRFDFIRIIAAWLVIYGHCYALTGSKEIELISKYLKFDTAGGLAVGIFFSISGFLVFKSLENSASLKIFILKRLLRVYPALILSVFLSIYFYGLICTNLSAQEYLSNELTFLYIQNITGFNIRYELPGVFENNHMKSVNGSLWSITMELKFYLLLGLISILYFNIRIKLWIIFIILSFLLILRPIEKASDLTLEFFGLSYEYNKFALMFTVGCLLSSYEKNVNFKYFKYIGLIAIMIALFIINFEINKSTFLIYHYLLPIIIIWIGLYFSFLPSIPHKIGDISYGLYLYSFTIQQFLIYFEMSNNLLNFILLSTFLSIVVSLISWRFVEKPFLNLKTKL